MARIQLDLVTPEKKVLSTEIDELVAPGAWGLFGVRPGHSPFLSNMEPGELSFFAQGRKQRYAIGGGFVEVANDHVTVLAETAEEASEIDVDRARKANDDAARKLATLREGEAEYRNQRARLQRAAVRIRIGSGP